MTVLVGPVGSGSDDGGWTDVGWVAQDGITFSTIEPAWMRPQSWINDVAVLNWAVLKPDWIVITPPGREAEAQKASEGLPNCKVIVSEQCPPDSVFMFNARAMRGDWPPGTFDR